MGSVAAEGIFECVGKPICESLPLNRRGPLWEPRGPLFFWLARFQPAVYFRGQTALGLGKPLCEGP